MAKKLHEIPTMQDFIKGLEKIRSQQLEARETSRFNKYPFEGTDNQYSHFPTGVVTPKGKHYLIDGNGELSFTGTKYLAYENQEAFPPFSAAELLLESKNDFKIDYAEAVKYYNLNKELAMKENENILSSKEFNPDHSITFAVNQEIREIKTMLEDHEKDFSKKPEVSTLLDEHFSKIEKLLVEFTDKLENASQKELPQLEENLKGKLSKIFTDLKDGLKQLLIDFKDQVRSGVENKVNDVKINIHNAFAEKVQGVNNKIKNFTSLLDEKYQVIEKTIPKEFPENRNSQNLEKQEPLLQDSSRKEEVSALTNVQKAFDDVQDIAKVQAKELPKQVENPAFGELKEQNIKLQKENAGLKTFVNVVKSKHPEVYQSIYNTMKGVQQNEQKQTEIEVKPKVKELELQI